jgi:hypothetical protein
MKNWAKIIAISSFGLAISGCAAYAGYLGINSRHGNSPEYCYDCHYQPRWVKDSATCGYYTFRVKETGYYYRPRSNKHAEFVFKAYDTKVVRERQRDDHEYRQHRQEHGDK